jgi:hypothetical protein
VSVAASVDKLLSGIELDDAGEARAAIARTLASKLDQASYQEAGVVAMAISGIAKELRATLDEILEATNETDEFVADLFS